MIKSRSLLDFKSAPLAVPQIIPQTPFVTPKADPKMAKKHFAFDIGPYEEFVEASMAKNCMTFEEFQAQNCHKSLQKQLSASDYLTQGLNASGTALKYLKHKKTEIEALRLKLSLLTFSDDLETIKGLLKELESLGVRIFWPESPKETDSDMLEKYNVYLENQATQEYFNRKNVRLYKQASVHERLLM